MYQIHFFPNRPKHNTNSIEEYFFKLLTLFAPAYLNVSKTQGKGGIYAPPMYLKFGLV